MIESFKKWWNAKIDYFRDAARPLKGWRTVIINAAMALAIIALEVTNYLLTTDVEQFIPSKWAMYSPWVIMAVNLLNIYLRFVTTTRVGYRDEETPTVEPKK